MPKCCMSVDVEFKDLMRQEGRQAVQVSNTLVRENKLDGALEFRLILNQSGFLHRSFFFIFIFLLLFYNVDNELF